MIGFLNNNIDFLENKRLEKNLNKMGNFELLIKNFIKTNQISKDIITLNNTLVFLSNLVDKIPNFKKTCKNLLEPLTLLVKEKTGSVRKSAAILLAKLCSEASNLNIARKFRATEILVNLSKFLIDK